MCVENAGLLIHEDVNLYFIANHKYMNEQNC